MTELHPLLISYYDEIDPPKRYAYLKEYAEAVGIGMSPADVYRIDLFNARHSNSNEKSIFGIFGKSKSPGSRAGSGNDSSLPNPPGELDVFLRELLVMLTIYKNGSPFPKKNSKDVLTCLSTLRVDDRPSRDKDCEEVLYLELRNAIKRYFSTCQDYTYGRKLLGLGIAKPEERERLRCFDTWGFSFGLARFLDLTEEMELICRAANDEYCASVDGAESLEFVYKKFGGTEKKR